MSDGIDGGLQAHDGAPFVHDPNTGRRYRLTWAEFPAEKHRNGRRMMRLVYEECSRFEEARDRCMRQYDQWDRPDVICTVLRPCPEHHDPNERICDECGCETRDGTCIFIGCPTNEDKPI